MNKRCCSILLALLLFVSSAEAQRISLSGIYGVSAGGTGLASGTSGGILGYTATGTLASSDALTANALVLGGGVGATPTALASLGTITTVLHGNAVGAPTFGAVSLTADVSGILPGANGGTGNAFFAVTGPTTSLKTFTFPDASSTVTTGTGTSGRLMVWGASNVAANSNYILAGATVARTYTFPDADSTIVTLGATQTLTAKTLTSPIITNIAPGANFTLTQNAVAALTSEETGAVVNTLYLKAGNIGIGTPGPGAKLQVAGTTWIGSPTAAAAYQLVVAVAQNWASFQNADYNNSNVGSALIVSSGAGTGDTYSQLQAVKAGGSAVGALSLNPSGGNVGIGTAVFGTSAAGILALGTGTAPSTSPADIVQMWAADVDGIGTFGKFLRGEAGDVFAWGNSKQRFPAFVFANIASVLTTNGEVGYCSDCTIANPCAGGGTGAIAKRLNAVQVCN